MVIWLTKRENPDVDAHGKEVVNWMIFVGIVGAASYAFALLGMLFGQAVAWAGGAMIFVGLLLVFVALLVAFVCAIIGAIKASEHKLFRYPMLFRAIK